MEKKKKFCPIVAEKLKTDREFNKRRIAEIKNCNDDVVLVLNVMKDLKPSLWLDYEVNVSWAVKSFDEVKDILKAFAKKKVMLEKYFPSDTNPVWKLKGLNTTIRLNPNWAGEASGAACRLMKVGEKVVIEPVYKLVCDGKELGEEISK